VEKINSETALIQKTGHSVQKTVLGGASINIGQLAILLTGATDLAHFARRINARATANTGNPLLEFYILRSQGVVP
jgi:hypothetical protein